MIFVKKDLPTKIYQTSDIDLMYSIFTNTEYNSYFDSPWYKILDEIIIIAGLFEVTTFQMVLDVSIGISIPKEVKNFFGALAKNNFIIIND